MVLGLFLCDYLSFWVWVFFSVIVFLCLLFVGRNWIQTTVKIFFSGTNSVHCTIPLYFSHCMHILTQNSGSSSILKQDPNTQV